MNATKMLAAAAMALVGQAASAAVLLATPATQTFTPGDTPATMVALPGGPYYGDIYVQFTVTLSPTTTLTNNDFAAIVFGNSASSTNTNIGIKADKGGTNPADFDYFVRTNSATAYSAPNISAAGALPATGRTAYVTGRLYKSTAGTTTNYDRFALWVNGVATSLDAVLASTPTALASGSTGLKSISTYGFRDANLDANDSVTFSGISILRVPEPGSVALLGLAGLAGFAASRRRRA